MALLILDTIDPTMSSNICSIDSHPSIASSRSSISSSESSSLFTCPFHLHALSFLHQLKDRHVISDLSLHQENENEGLSPTPKWKVTVKIDYQGCFFYGKAKSRKSAIAKRLAALSCLQTLQNGSSSLCAEHADIDCIEATQEQEMTEKEKKVAAIANAELSKIRRLATLDDQASEHTLVLSVDQEHYDRPPRDAILEIGIASAPLNSTFGSSVDCRHLIVQDHLHFTNSGALNHREDFLYGSSEYVNLDDLGEQVTNIITRATTRMGQVAIVGCNNSEDIKLIRSQLGVDIEGLVPNIEIIDIGKAFMALRQQMELTSLSNINRYYGLDASEPHNGGNDAVYGVNGLQAIKREIQACDGSRSAIM